MPELSVVLVTTDEDQKALLQVLVDGTVVARMKQSFAAYPRMDGDGVAIHSGIGGERLLHPGDYRAIHQDLQQRFLIFIRGD